MPLVLLAAGGTGGHLFPAEALAAALGKRGVAVELVTDVRAKQYSGQFPASAIHVIPIRTPERVVASMLEQGRPGHYQRRAVRLIGSSVGPGR